MLLPQALLRLRGSVKPMVTTDIARAVGDAAREFLGKHGGILTLLVTETAWVEEFEAFAEIIAETVPGVPDRREARALAGRSAGLYVPGTGALINGALIAGRTRAEMGPALDDADIAGRVATHLAHEVAGHGYMAENTPMGLSQIAHGSWRQAVAFGSRVLPMQEALSAAERPLADLSLRTVVVAEGWARWITERLKPLLAQRLPGLSDAITGERRQPRQMEADQTAERLVEDLTSGRDSSDSLRARASALFDDVSLGRGPVTPRALGFALFRALEAGDGVDGCVSSLHAACGRVRDERPDVAVLMQLAARSRREQPSRRRTPIESRG